MEFKVIFAGFALHCVLNAVLICKSVVTKGQEELKELTVQKAEKSMLNEIASGEAPLMRLQVEGTSGQPKTIKIIR
jgi:hypothetical protein